MEMRQFEKIGTVRFDEPTPLPSQAFFLRNYCVIADFGVLAVGPEIQDINFECAWCDESELFPIGPAPR